MRTLLENLREDERAPVLEGVKWAGRYIVNDIGQAIAEIERLQRPDLLAQLRQCQTELEEAAKLLRPSLPGVARIYDAAAHRVSATLALAMPR